METANEHKPAYKLLENHIPGKDIILYDRGFASAALIQKFRRKRHIPCCQRSAPRSVCPDETLLCQKRKGYVP